MYRFQGRDVFETVAEMVNPAHTVVMVHDMQNDFLHKDGAYRKAGENYVVVAQDEQLQPHIDVSTILGPMIEFVRKARGYGVKIWQTNYTNLPDFGSFDDAMVNKRWALMNDPAERDHANPVVLGTWGNKTIDELKPQEGDIVVNKYRTNTFIHSNFELLLRSHGIKTIIPTGPATEVGILPTYWYAVLVGFFPVVPRDLVSARVAEYHEDAMKFLERLVWVVDSSEILEAWEKGSQST